MNNDTVKKRRWDFSTPDAIFDVDGIDIYAQTIYILLCAHADRDGKSFPAYDTLAKRGRMSRRKAIDSVSALVEKGLLLKKPQRRGNGADTSNQYTIIDAYDFLQQKDAEPVSEVSANSEEGSARHAPGGVHAMHRGGARHAPKHNHLILPSLNMIDCMSRASAEIAVARAESSLDLESRETDPIYEALQRYVPVNCYVDSIPLTEAYINDIYLLLINQFENRLDPEVVQIACELYFERACRIELPHGVVMKTKIENPIGYFRWCYEDAIKQYKATGSKKGGKRG